MQSYLLLFLAFGMTVLGYRLHHCDEVHAMALYSVGFLSGIWGFSLVPSTVQLALGVIAIAWLQVGSFQR